MISVSIDELRVLPVLLCIGKNEVIYDAAKALEWARRLIQGKQDFITSVDATWALYTKRVEAGVPAINVVFPWTDHAFDLAFLQTYPAAQSVLYDVDRFLALLSN